MRAELGTISGAGRAWDLNVRPGLNGWSNCYHRVNLTSCTERLFRTFRFALSAMDMEQRDYDSRTALHVAAAEGNARTACCYGFYRLQFFSKLKSPFVCWGL